MEHYNTIIGNAIIVKGVFFYEINLLELGEDTDLYIGILSKNCLIFSENKYRNFPISYFKDGYGINLNIYY